MILSLLGIYVRLLPNVLHFTKIGRESKEKVKKSRWLNTFLVLCIGHKSEIRSSKSETSTNFQNTKAQNGGKITTPDRKARKQQFPCCRPRVQYLGDKLEVNSNERVIWINSRFFADLTFIRICKQTNTAIWVIWANSEFFNDTIFIFWPPTDY